MYEVGISPVCTRFHTIDVLQILWWTRQIPLTDSTKLDILLGWAASLSCLLRRNSQFPVIRDRYSSQHPVMYISPSSIVSTGNQASLWSWTCALGLSDCRHHTNPGSYECVVRKHELFTEHDIITMKRTSRAIVIFWPHLAKVRKYLIASLRSIVMSQHANFMWGLDQNFRSS